MAQTSLIFGVYGAGAWGTALAQVAAMAGHKVWLAGRDEAAAAATEAARENPRLPGVRLHPGITVTADPGTLSAADAVLLAAPAQMTRLAAASLARVLPARTVIVSCAKGIERSTGLLLSEVLEQAMPGNPLAILSGPGFAADVSLGLPTAVTVAARDMHLAEDLARALAGPSFRPYAAQDIAGVQLGGALKNVLAIAAGVVDGQKLGASAEAAVITRGFVEMRRLAAAWGARGDTLMGLSGFGDVILTCRSEQSRNFAYGRAIGLGQGLDTGGAVVEGAATAAIAVQKAQAFGLDVPIMSAVANVVEGHLTVAEALENLLARPLKREDHV